MAGKDYYKILGVKRDASEQELKRTDALQRKFGKVEAQGYHVFALP